MITICVDDERKIMEYTVRMCNKLPQISDVQGFVHSSDALRWLEEHPADLALLDIDMPGMNGIELAVRMKKLRPDIAIIFLTGFAQYAVDAFAIHANGYLMKPVTEDGLAENIDYVLSERHQKQQVPHVMIRTFGGFDVFADGKLVAFSPARCKELFAYLVDRQGNSVTRAEAFSILWEDRVYDRPMQKQLDDIIRRMRKTLQDYGIEEIFEMKRGTMRVRPELLHCDAYSFFEGDVSAMNAYHGEYMSSYSWANITESYMTWKMTDKP